MKRLRHQIRNSEIQDNFEQIEEEGLDSETLTKVLATLSVSGIGGIKYGVGKLKWAASKVSGIVVLKHELGKEVKGIALVPIAAGPVPSLATSGVPSSTEIGVVGELILATTVELSFFWMVFG